MLLHTFEQGSPEWYQIRIGKVTGSEFSRVLSSKWIDYSDKIAAEQLTGYSETDDMDGFVSFDMQRGKDLEPLAAAEYERIYNVKLDQYGFIQSAEFDNLGISPDRVGTAVEFAVEIKSPRVSTHLRYIRHDKIPSTYLPQILCYFVVCNSIQYVDFVSYCPDLEARPIWIKRVMRSELAEEIEQAKTQLSKFFTQVEKTKQLVTGHEL